MASESSPKWQDLISFQICEMHLINLINLGTTNFNLFEQFDIPEVIIESDSNTLMMLNDVFCSLVERLLHDRNIKYNINNKLPSTIRVIND